MCWARGGGGGDAFAAGVSFATARNLALDALRHRAVSGEETCVPFESLDVLDGSDGIPEIINRHEKLAPVTEAIRPLPAYV